MVSWVTDCYHPLWKHKWCSRAASATTNSNLQRTVTHELLDNVCVTLTGRARILWVFLGSILLGGNPLRELWEHISKMSYQVTKTWEYSLSIPISHWLKVTPGDVNSSALLACSAHFRASPGSRNRPQTEMQKPGGGSLWWVQSYRDALRGWKGWGWGVIIIM